MLETVLHVVGHVGTDVDHRKVGESTDPRQRTLRPCGWMPVAAPLVDVSDAGRP